MAWKVEFEPNAEGEFAGLTDGQRKLAKVAIEQLKNDPYGDGTSIVEDYPLRKIKFAGNLRIIYDVQTIPSSWKSSQSDLARTSTSALTTYGAAAVEERFETGHYLNSQPTRGCWPPRRTLLPW